MRQRYPVYETSDLVVESGGDTHDVVVDRIIDALDRQSQQGSNAARQ